jgi:Zn-dependent protease with chaperone function
LFGFLGLWYLTPVSDWITDAVLVLVPIESDIDLGHEAWRSMNYRSVQDRWGVNRIGHELVSKLSQDQSSTSVEMPWSFGVIHADFVNAFALPGGIVRVTDTLLEQLKLSDAELAALIGHEMGHVLHRHSQARVLKEQLIVYLIQAVFYEDNDGYEETFGEAVGELLLKSATFLGKQSFSRKNEYEADATAWQLLDMSRHYSPQAVESLLQKLWDLQGGSGETAWESTHPGTADRIEALKVKWEKLPLGERSRLKALEM